MRHPQVLNKKANKCEARMVSHGVYEVVSSSGSIYTVDLNDGGVCNCEWQARGNAGCSHEMAARKLHSEITEGRQVSFLEGTAPEVARKQHKATAQVCTGIVQVTRAKVKVTVVSPRVIDARFLWPRWTPPDDMDYWMVHVEIFDGGVWRKSTLGYGDLMALDGWVATEPKMTHANHKGREHLFEFKLVREAR